MENPELIQGAGSPEHDASSPNNKLPLFLIHDGGGTTFSYHCLEPLHRPAYGLFNPRYHSGGSFEGGVPGMGRLYAVMIKQTCAKPDFPGQRNADGSVDILLGGWSMGGLLSFEVAKVLTGDREVHVVGVLMVESMCPVRLPTGGGYLETLDHLDLSRTDKNLTLSIRAMKEALRVIRDWEPPVWEGDELELRPRFSLVRALDPLPSNGKRVHILDIYRRDKALGWDKYDPGLFLETTEARGNHFDMFSFENIPGISEAIKRCCDTLEMAHRS